MTALVQPYANLLSTELITGMGDFELLFFVLFFSQLSSGMAVKGLNASVWL